MFNFLGFLKHSFKSDQSHEHTGIDESQGHFIVTPHPSTLIISPRYFSSFESSYSPTNISPILVLSSVNFMV